MLTIHNGFQTESNVDRLYLSRSEGGSGLIGAQDTVETAILRLRDYLINRKERLLIAAHTKEDNEDRETPNEYKERKKIKGKHGGHKKNYTENSSGKQQVK